MHGNLVGMSRRAVQPAAVPSVGEHAEENLQFIRRTMERSSTFTAVPGMGGAAMGAIGLAAAIVAANQPSAERWLIVWLLAAAVAVTVGVIAVLRKAARLDAPLAGPVGRRFAMSLAGPLVAGAALTFGVWRSGDQALMPAVWLLLYGTAVLGGGAFSVAAVRMLGAAFITLGVFALVTPPAWGNVWLGVGFGVLHIACGLYIAKRHGG
jgi:MFS family permease